MCGVRRPSWMTVRWRCTLRTAYSNRNKLYRLDESCDT
ncbi:hypothetical protein EMIT043CA1_130013 [Pseudomonas brassicacearum]